MLIFTVLIALLIGTADAGRAQCGQHAARRFPETTSPAMRSAAESDTWHSIRVHIDNKLLTPGQDMAACSSVGQNVVIGESNTGPCDSHNRPTNCLYKCKADDVVSDDIKNTVAEAVAEVQGFYQKFLMVEQFDRPITQGCTGVADPTQPVNADFLVFVTARPMVDPESPVLATAAPCVFDDEATKRPYVAYLNAVPRKVRTARTEDFIATIKHEMLHGLGFTENSYKRYRFPGSTKAYQEYSKVLFPTGPVAGNAVRTWPPSGDVFDFSPSRKAFFVTPSRSLKCATSTTPTNGLGCHVTATGVSQNSVGSRHRYHRSCTEQQQR